MGAKIKRILRKISLKRTTVLAIVFIFMSCVLIHRLFQLQIIQGEDYVNSFQLQTTKTRTLSSTRGNIFDRDGKALAYNQLAYSITLEDNGTYTDTKSKNLFLNGMLYRLVKILEKNGDSVDTSNFHIVLDENGEFVFDVDEGFTLNRFRADIYGQIYIDDLTEKQSSATAESIMKELCSEDRFLIATGGKDNVYSKEEQEEYQLPEFFSLEDALKIALIRYQLSNNQFVKYLAVTIATDVSEETVASVMENKSSFQGVEVVEDSIRVYEDHVSLGPILGYTGKASYEELEELQKEDSTYTINAVIGKAGIEQYMETTLKGTDGQETVSVDNMGKVLRIDEDTKVEPVAGKDVYLTIKTEWQKDIYEILKQRVAGILLSKIENTKTFDRTAITDSIQIRIPIYDCYFQLINNNIIDIEKFEEADASETEKTLFAKFQQKQQEVFDKISNEFNGDNTAAYKDQSEEMQEYIHYLENTFLMQQEGILSSNMIDTSDPIYRQWEDEGTLSLKAYLTYAAGQNWIDISKISSEQDYLDSSEVYQTLAAYTEEKLRTDLGFCKLLYKYMLQEDRISGEEVCLVLYEQGVLDKNDNHYESLASGTMSAYDFMTTKIYTLEIEPAMLALEPCSASAVVVDPYTGDTLACVTYPGYDNNRLSNNIDLEYYVKLATDLSTPFYNKATQQRTAPGSTFKLASAITGILNGVVQQGTTIECTGSFELVQPPINCWNTYGCGLLDLNTAIEVSCNTYFNTVGFELGKNAEGEFSEAITLSKLQETASLLGLDKKSGIELTETSPHVSDSLGVPSYIGQGTNDYTTTQLARYAAVLANSGTAYKLTLLDKVTDSSGNILEEYQPEVVSQVTLDDVYWDEIHDGMRRVISSNTIFSGLEVEAAGKTGTAQERTDIPDHALIIGYAPYDTPQYAIAVRVANGYASGNTCYIADDIFKYLFSAKDKKSLITGYASSETSDVSND